MKKFVIYILLLTLSFGTIIGLINYVIDPFNIFETKFLPFQYQRNERFIKIKYLDTHHTHFNSYLIGSSRIGTTNPKVLETYIANSKFYNMTLSSATLSDELRHIRYMISAGYRIKNLYLQIDLNNNMTSYLYPTSDYLRKPHPHITGESLSLYYLDYLLNPFPTNTKGKIVKNLEGKNDDNYDLLLGNWNRPEKDKKISQNCSNFIKSEPTFNMPVNPKVKNTYTKINMLALKNIIELSKKNNINLILFTTPHNHNYLDIIYEKEYYIFLKELLNITDYWDFSGYNSITTNDCNYYDSSHYTPQIGNLIAAKIFNDKNIFVPSDFGVFITHKNFESHINQLKMDRKRWKLKRNEK
ncbi:hypothetical protein [Sulfuricurvum sp.]|uniref:hypothetical protein n=1 Tax=Sulfuricurvum sp. TaxID=2025608 RepID=UPI002D637039|nr:hypothetical protein [Sulfuricurvum sp.]HZF69982.1 hypothetical protein [Sulfuricurvum sp.]